MPGERDRYKLIFFKKDAASSLAGLNKIDLALDYVDCKSD